MYVCICCSLIANSNSFVTPWTVAHWAPLSMGLPREEYWSGLPFPSPGDLPDSGIEPLYPILQADSLPLRHQGRPYMYVCVCIAVFVFGIV